ncbi:amidohydrolase [Phaeovulum vinaykumarii]|uniref:Amidohydrolase n=1 Tax=Phaeovulum vinaykumarii TaxID=407234 RepID=A0A1N7JWB3_9RHOB|nr:amidohydrolase [Phaeovulum vinaykumarii]SIS53645.1 amidohydrolase [Phaeovulum vinaykumarii]SOB91665.1 amidohydrolase [Phaeovulum vinaykumarii]
MLGPDDLHDLTALRHALHAAPDLSGDEGPTAARLGAFLAPLGPAQLIEGLGGTGLAAVFEGAAPGPTLMLRAELDALPIPETNDVPHASRVPGRGHLCGHDGHMAILCAVARVLARRPPLRGRVVLLFQPAEETGQGAAAVLADPRFAALAPDRVLALHNLPGLPLGHVGLVAGPMCCASRGLEITLAGRTAHASMPETGRSPAGALARLIPALTALGTGHPAGGALAPGFRLATITHAALGVPSFGISPGTARLMVTLRSLEDAGMARLCAEAEALIRAEAAADGLCPTLSWHDDFAACTNDPGLIAEWRAPCAKAGLPVIEGLGPMRWSEDFGRFGAVAPAALAILGAGETHPQLHNPDYDFPDALIAPGAALFLGAVAASLGLPEDDAGPA